jgi:elongation factor G
MMEAAKAQNLPRAIIINKIDSPEVDLAGLIESLRETFGPECLPINLPANSGKAVVECLLNTEGESDFDTVKRCHAAMLDQIVEMDENLMEKYLGGEEPDFKALHPAFEKAIDEGHVVPILFCDAKAGVGVKELLDAIIMHFPSPEEGNPEPFMIGEGENEKRYNYNNDVRSPLLAHVFKVTTDPFVGKLAIFRIHQGKVSGQSQVFIGHNKKPVKLGHIFNLQGKEHKESHEIIAGDIGAVAKIEEIHTNDVLHDDHALDSVHLKPLAFPTPMYGLAITPKARGDEQKLSSLLTKIAEEDPTFKWHSLRTAGSRSIPSRPKSPIARPSCRRPTGTTATRSRPAAPGSSAKSSFASSRYRPIHLTAKTKADRAWRSSTKSSAGPSPASSSPPSRKAFTTCSTKA